MDHHIAIHYWYTGR